MRDCSDDGLFGWRIRDAGCAMRDAGGGMRGAGCAMLDGGYTGSAECNPANPLILKILIQVADEVKVACPELVVLEPAEGPKGG